MQNDPKNTKTFLKAINGLRQFIQENDYENGGWLPSGRGMAKKLKVSHPTYCKALNFLVNEGIANSFPKKGHFVIPEFLRIHKIGFILNGGNESPFIQTDCGLTDAIDYLENQGYYSQVIQAAKLEQLYDTAKSMGLMGLLWFYPPSNAKKTIQNINKNGDIPLVLVQNQAQEKDFASVCVKFSTEKSFLRRLDTLISHGHKHIAYIGPYDSKKARDAKKFGIDLSPENCLEDNWCIEQDLLALIREKQITGILSEGSGLRIYLLFKELSKLPDEEMPEVVASSFPQLTAIHKRFPKVKLIYKKPVKRNSLGLIATKMLINHIKEKTPLKSLEVDFEKIESNNGRQP